MKKCIKIAKLILVSLLLLLVIVLYTIPRVIPTYVEKNSQELIGRKVTMGMVRINYATLTLRITDFALYEKNASDVFVSLDVFSVNLDLIPTLKGNYTIASMLVDNMDVNIEFDGEYFNFDDMIVAPDTLVDVEENVVADEIKFTLKNIELREGGVSYYDNKEDIHHELSNIGFVLPHLSWDSDVSSEMDLKFKFEPQGMLELKANLDYSLKRYDLSVEIIDLALAPFSVYLKPWLASEGIQGVLNNSVYVSGSIDNPEDVLISGEMEIDDFLLKDESGNPIFENSLLGVYLDSIDLKNSYYGISKIHIGGPQVHASLDGDITNFDLLIKPMTDGLDTLQNEAVAETDEIDSSYFQIDTFLLDAGAVFFVDNSLNRPFIYNITSIRTLVTDINPMAQKVPVDYSLVLNETANLAGDVKLNMLNAEELEYSAELKGLDLTSFSPYSEFYIARPIKSGHLKFKGNAMMTGTEFKAENSISINDIELGEKTADDAQVNIPVNLALGILKDKNGDVKFDVPLEGDPSDPEFNMGKLIGKTLSDFVLKVAATPFAIVGDIAGVNPERLKEIPLELTQYELAEKEKKTLGQIAIALEKKPELEFHFTLEVPTEEEKVALATRYVKEDYLKALDTKKKDMNEALEALENDDDGLMAYVHEKSISTTDLSFGEQCVSIVGDDKLMLKVSTLTEARNAYLESYLLDSLQLIPTDVEIRTMDTENHTVDIDQSRYRVEVSVK